MVDADLVLNFIKKKGPAIPRHVVKELGGDTFLIGAILSGLSNERKIRLTHAKWGGTPLYYLPEQREKIQLMYKFLHEKEKKAFDILKEKRILRDSSLSPLMRVALRNIKDFARPLEVKIKGEKELFWKWYMLSTEDASLIIKKLVSPAAFGKRAPFNKEPTTEQKKEIKKSHMKKTEEKKTESSVPTKESKQIVKQKEVKKEEILKKVDDTGDIFLKKIMNVFEVKNIKIIEKEIIKKKSEIDLIIKFQSSVGELKYYCKARNKKRINDKDISSALVTSQNKKLPLLFATTGELTKKTKNMLNKDLSGIHIFYIE